MSFALNARNQVTLPNHICLALGVKPGDEIDYEISLDGEVFLKPSSPQQQQKSKLKIQQLPTKKSAK
jgi:bifunctional DNA-binding transcriptional regulator/antitoxin component of YhaV-PrlF toxin-antitoxin module